MLFYRKKSRGIITVFVTLILVPVIVCTGTMVDLARIKLYSSQTAMASDMYSEAILTEYDYVLKELYGLFAITQNDVAKDEVEELAEMYAKCTFNPNADESVEIGGWMPYKDAEVSITCVAIAASSLCVKTENAENAVLSTQIGDFMKFRIVQQVVEEMKLLDMLEGFENRHENMDAIETRADMSDSGEEALKLIGEYYSILKLIYDYKSYLDNRKDAIDAYAEAIKEAYDSKDSSTDNIDDAYDYEDYIGYLDNKTAIDEAKKAVEAAEKAGETVDADVQSLADKYVDVDGFKKYWKTRLDGYDTDIDAGYGIKFGDVAKKLEDLEKKASEIEASMEDLRQQIIVLEGEVVDGNKVTDGKLDYCDQELADSVRTEIDGLREIVKWAEHFREMVNNQYSNDNDIKDYDGNGNNNNDNKEYYENKISELNEDKEAFLNGELENYSLNNTISLSWYDFTTDTNSTEFYNFLKSLCGGGSSSGSNKGADEAIKENAQNEIDNALDNMDKEDEKDSSARDISDKLLKQLSASDVELDTGKPSTSLDGCSSFGNIGAVVVNKFMLTGYDFGMFSSRVSGIEKPEDDSKIEEELDSSLEPTAGSLDSETTGNLLNNTGGTDTGQIEINVNKETSENELKENESEESESEESDSEEEDEYYDESLTGYRMSRDLNYLYGAELEYIIAGSSDSSDNLKYTRNIIFGVRMATNFVSTYTIKEINQPISSIANSAATAVAGTGVGAALAPLVRVLVSGALRLLVATIESTADWALLKQREDVLFFKGDIQDLSMVEVLDMDVDDLLGGATEGVDLPEDNTEIPDNKKMSLNIKLSYEDYVYIILLCMTGDDEQLERTADLITLNVNQYKQGGPEELETLDFKMTDTVTAVKTTCEVNMEFMFVPDYLINSFLGSDSEYNDVVTEFENNTYGYTMIRGY